MKLDIYISTDVEADGPIPGDYSMLSLGASVLGNPENTFYRELKPVFGEGDPETVTWLKKQGLDREKLKTTGIDPKTAMEEFTTWLKFVSGSSNRPVFVAFNATYDWMFVYWYLVHFTNSKPFGISGLDIKAYYMGAMGKTQWTETSKRNLDPRFIPDPNELPHTHNALDDAREQAEIFLRIKQHAETKNTSR